MVIGHHHISMYTKYVGKNDYFYQEILGLRRVKVSVNQDDPFMYHVFYGDLTGSPGTELTFFEIPLIGNTYRGTNAITQIGLLVPSYQSLLYWQDRFSQFQVKHSNITKYAGHDAIHFEDHEGLRYVLLNHAGRKIRKEWEAWPKSPVLEHHRILGMGSVEMTVESLPTLADTLEKLLGYNNISRKENEAVFQAVEGEVFGEIVVKQLPGMKERRGKGSIHHLAIEVEGDLEDWEEKIKNYGYRTSGIVDRFYFKSLYFTEEHGITFELVSSNAPGFTADSTVEELGTKLDLPPFLEHRRAEIEAKLVPIDEWD